MYLVEEDEYELKRVAKKPRTEPTTVATTTTTLSESESRLYDTVISTGTNHVYFYTGINHMTSIKFIEKVNEAVSFILKKHIELSTLGILQRLPLVIHVRSPGGSVFAVFAMIDKLRMVKQQHQLEIHTIVEGMTASAGTLLSIIGDKRFITQYAYMLIHQLSSFVHGKYEEICDGKENVDELMNRIKNFYNQHATIPRNKLSEILKHDLYWNATKCVEFGLADEIL